MHTVLDKAVFKTNKVYFVFQVEFWRGKLHIHGDCTRAIVKQSQIKFLDAWEIFFIKFHQTFCNVPENFISLSEDYLLGKPNFLSKISENSLSIFVLEAVSESRRKFK